LARFHQQGWRIVSRITTYQNYMLIKLYVILGSLMGKAFLNELDLFMHISRCWW
jgi:hypothetical protein